MPIMATLLPTREHHHGLHLPCAFPRCNAQLAADMEDMGWASTCSIASTLDGAVRGAEARIKGVSGENILINAAMPVGAGSEMLSFEQNRRQ